ncbi:TIGR02117 family protein [Sphingomonas sp. G124]|uniref:TIGR02117 family protein n=1 Tax=Sphingomonas cremea TaxID=2904799 RepID=A0A9X1QPD7_9SPHN|nr:TIGR02117 family protein [Sphingomonas cremea]MCF2515832.1 TIGR02117 family protein [Sphingomonas cremea]
MPRRRRRKKLSWPARIALAVLAIPLLYLLAALIGGLIPVNASWQEPDDGITIYLANNGVHVDLVLPASTQGLDWRPLLPKSDFADVPADADWIAFGAGERRVYLETPTWGDLSFKTAAVALTGGDRVMHVEWTRDPTFAARAIRLTPEQYRRLWASIRAGFELDRNGRPIRIGHPGYGPRDAFYRGTGKANAVHTCNQWVASRLRLAGVKTPLWSPFVQGLVPYYRPANQRT